MFEVPYNCLGGLIHALWMCEPWSVYIVPYEPLDEVQQYERGNVVEIYDGIIFDFNTSTYLSL